MDWIIEYVAAVLEMDETDYTDKNSVNRHNKLARRIRAIASEIECSYPKLKPNFYQLLFHEKAIVRSWVAHHILEVMCYEDGYRRDALKEITDISTNVKSINRIGNKMWLEKWLEEHPADRELLKNSNLANSRK